jgi:hypothetical protein
LTAGEALPGLVARLCTVLEPRPALPEVGAATAEPPAVVSLGTHCLTAYYLRLLGLRRATLPFDWAFASPAMVADCLENDFAVLLDRRHHQSITAKRATGEPGADHSLYRDRFGVGDVFAHRDVTQEADYAHVVRCVARFRAALAAPGPLLFVAITRPEHDLVAAFGRLGRLLRQRTAQPALLGIQLRPPAEPPCGPPGSPGGTPRLRLLRGGVAEALYELTPETAELGLGFQAAADDAAVLLALHRQQVALQHCFAPT